MLHFKSILVLLLVLGTITGVGVAVGQEEPVVSGSPTPAPGDEAVEDAEDATPPPGDAADSTEDEEATENPEAVILAGQEALLAEMVGNGATLPGQCTFEGGKIERSVIKSTYKCPAGEVVFELRHPSTATPDANQTAKFAIIVQSGSPPAGLLEAVVSLVRSREAAFEWTWVHAASPDQPARKRSSRLIVLAAGVLGAVALGWVLRRRGRRATKP